MDKDVPLVVPEVNPEEIPNNNGIIANPNCSTIQAVIPLKALDEKYKIKRIVYSTYQAVSGAGQEGVNDLKNGLEGIQPKKFPYQIVNTCIPHIDKIIIVLSYIFIYLFNPLNNSEKMLKATTLIIFFLIKRELLLCEIIIINIIIVY